MPLGVEVGLQEEDGGQDAAIALLRVPPLFGGAIHIYCIIFSVTYLRLFI